MTTTNTFDFVASITYDDGENVINTEYCFDPYNDYQSMDDLKTKALEVLEEENEGQEFDEANITVEITDFDNMPEKWANEKDCFDFAESAANCSYDIDVVQAALQCDVNPSDIDEVYQGTYKDDEDFAYDMAEQLGAIDKNAAWPNTCIDWEYAAKELMYDYSSHNGHYFRNL